MQDRNAQLFYPDILRERTVSHYLYRHILLGVSALLLCAVMLGQVRTLATGRACFAETGACIDDRFRAYWEQNGGLPVFGYPITSARQDVNPDTGKTYLTQWFERNRFELHPENAAPYDVLLSRLGVEVLLKQDRDWQTFPKAPAGTPHFFRETGHAIAHEPFWQYWSSHGLHLDNRPAISHEESLALFGLPLSEPQIETNSSGDTVLTQWFERARFEWHPNELNQYKVFLGLLAAGGTIRWSASHETGNFSEWERNDGGGIFNTGTGEATITTEVAHTGSHAAKLRITDADGTHGNQAVRIVRWNEADHTPAAYYSAWFYFPQVYRPTEWWTVFQFKSRTAEQNDAFWQVDVWNRPSGEMYFSLWDWQNQQWYSQNLSTIPVGRWFQLEVYYKQAAENTGQVTVWQDGVQIFNIPNVQTMYPNSEVHWSVTSYTNDINPHAATIYVDDAAISTARVGP
jgi:hypothetical protein